MSLSSSSDEEVAPSESFLESGAAAVATGLAAFFLSLEQEASEREETIRKRIKERLMG